MEMIRSIFVILLILSTLHNLNAQTPELDSLEAILKDYAAEDTFKVNLLNKIGLKSNRYDLNKTFSYGQKAGQIGESIGFKKGQAEGLRLVGEYYMRKSEPDRDSALLNLEQALHLFEELNNRRGIGQTYRSLGTCYFFLNNFYKSLEYSHKSLSILEELGLKEEIANILTNIGSLHSIQYNPKEALDYYTKALNIFEELGIKFKRAVCLYNISDMHIRIGSYSDALDNLEKSMVILEELNLKTMIPSGLNNLGNIKKLQKDYTEALTYYNRSLNQSESLGLKGTACDNLIGLAEVHYALKNFNKAEEYGIRGLALADEMSILERQKQIHAVLSKIYEVKKDYKKAYTFHKQFKILSDSLFNEENIKKLAGLEYQYEFDQEKQAILLEQQKKDVLQAEAFRRQKLVRNAFIYGFVLVLLLVLAIMYNLIQKQKANKKLTALNKSKDDIFSIVAHDLRAPVGNIKAFIELILSNQKNYDHQETMTIMARLGTQSASVFNILENLFAWANSQRQNIVLNASSQPLNHAIESNINLLKDSAKAKNISITNKVNSELAAFYDLMLISTVVRNLLANAVKFTHENGEIIINAEEVEQYVQVSITDSGVGIDPKKVKSIFDPEVYETTLGTNSERGSGLGLKLSHEFVTKHNGKIWVESEVDKGSKFVFTLPREE
ncbi:MAG: tetratricopeptide repeat-containing sensor histidine kinase [Reichenbachiella sp.]|uniref:tetratricopeptide repeat-containing sensor histidine kinase n=2 Tax=Reichenbachiella sp. TaxID=2184521 RepID=UPI0032654E81